MKIIILKCKIITILKIRFRSKKKTIWKGKSETYAQVTTSFQKVSSLVTIFTKKVNFSLSLSSTLTKYVNSNKPPSSQTQKPTYFTGHPNNVAIAIFTPLRAKWVQSCVTRGDASVTSRQPSNRPEQAY